jgi:hypothetical protein
MPSEPKRIQRKRTKGWRMPPNAVYVGRPTVFGNPFGCNKPHMCPHAPCSCCDPTPLDGYCCVDAFREYVLSGIEGRPACTGTLTGAALAMVDEYKERNELVRRLPELRGKDLVCWCGDGPCHADVLGCAVSRTKGTG